MRNPPHFWCDVHNCKRLATMEILLGTDPAAQVAQGPAGAHLMLVCTECFAKQQAERHWKSIETRPIGEYAAEMEARWVENGLRRMFPNGG